MVISYSVYASNETPELAELVWESVPDIDAVQTERGRSLFACSPSKLEMSMRNRGSVICVCIINICLSLGYFGFSFTIFEWRFRANNSSYYWTEHGKSDLKYETIQWIDVLCHHNI